MSDLEFQRELSPDQIHEALSLLDNAAGGKRGRSQAGELGPSELGAGELEAGELGITEDVDPETGKARATMAPQREPAATADPQQQAKRFNRSAIFFFCLGAAAMATLALVSWSERALTRPSPPAISASLPVPAANPPSGQTPGGSEQGAATAAASGSLPADAADRDAAADAAVAAGATLGKTGTGAAAAAAATEPAPPDEPAQHKPTEARRHSRASRIVTAKRRPWHSHPAARAETGRGQCSFFLCLSWQSRHVFYEPPRNVTQ